MFVRTCSPSCTVLAVFAGARDGRPLNAADALTAFGRDGRLFHKTQRYARIVHIKCLTEQFTFDCLPNFNYLHFKSRFLQIVISNHKVISRYPKLMPMWMDELTGCADPYVSFAFS